MQATLIEPYSKMRPTRMARPLIAAAVSLLAAAFGASAANAACDDNVWGIASSGALYTFVPPTAAATRAAGNPTLNYGTIARGTYSGYIYAIGSTGKNDKLVAYKPATNTSATVGTFPNTSFLYASGFGPNGLAYAMSSSEVYSFTDAPTPIITKLGAPVTTSGPAITAFDSGDVAVDQNGNGWVVLSNNATGLSYLYEITFGAASTQLSQAAQITLGGKAYTTADLYSLAFGPVDAKLYASSGTNGTLYQINQATGALTSEGAQGFELTDFGSCTAQGTTTLAKTGPTKSGAGELLAYAITAANSSTSHVSETALTLSDTVPTGIAITSESCTVTGGAVCGTPAVAGQTVTVTISSLPINASATLNIHGRDTALAVGTTTNTATVATAFGTLATASAATSVVAT